MEFLRVRQEGAEVVQLAIDKISGLQVSYDGIEYGLIAYTDSMEFIVKIGTFDECHLLLNKINKKLDLKIIDL